MANAKNNRRGRLTKKILKDSLMELMETRPISKISVKMLCETADINRSTFYAHYADQYALLQQLEEETFFELMQYVNNIEHHLHEKNNQETRQSMKEILYFIKKNANVFTVLLSKNGDSRFHEDLMLWVHEKTMEDVWETRLAETSMSEYLQAFMAEGALNCLRTWLNKGMTEPVEEFSDFLINVIEGGVYSFFAKD